MSDRIPESGKPPPTAPTYQKTGPEDVQKTVAKRLTQESSISRKQIENTDESGLPLVKLKKLDPNNPTLDPPRDFENKAFVKITQDLENKFKEQIPLEKLQERISADAPAKDREKLTNEILEVSTSTETADERTLRIQFLLMQITRISGRTTSIALDQTAKEQAEIGRKNIEQEMKILAAERTSASSALASKIFSWLGKIFNVIAAVVGIIGAKLATAATVGAASPLVIGAYVWLGAAVAGLAFQIANEAGLNKVIADKLVAPMLKLFGVSDPEAYSQMIVGLCTTAIEIGLSIASAVVTGGATAGELATVTYQNLLKAVSGVMDFVRITGESATKVVSAVHRIKVSFAEMEKVEIEKIKSSFDFVSQNLVRILDLIMKALNDLAKVVSSDIRSSGTTKSTLASNIGGV